MKGLIIIADGIIAFVIYAAIVHYLFDRIFEELDRIFEEQEKKQQKK